jgi:hypothetical protein
VTADDLPTRGIRGVAGDPGSAQGGAVQDRRLIQVGDDDRGVRRGPVQLCGCRRPVLGDGLDAPSADDPDPLARGGSRGLLAEHGQPLTQRRDSVPAQFQDEVQSTAHHVVVRVIQPGDDAAAEAVDDARPGTDQRGDVLVGTDHSDTSVADSQGGSARAAWVPGEDLRVAQDEVGGLLRSGRADPGHRHRCHHHSLGTAVRSSL